MITLFHYPLCPFSRKVRLVLAEKKLNYHVQLEPMWKKQSEFIDLNPTGQVPVLIEENVVISGSQAIVEYLDESRPHNPLMPVNIAERAEVRRLINHIDDCFYHAVIHKIVYEKTLKRNMGLGGPDSRHIREGIQNLDHHCDYFSYLIEKRTWLAQEKITLADFCLAAHISCLDYLNHFPWEKYPLIKEWYMCLKSRPSFQPILRDNVPGLVTSMNYDALDF